MRQQYSIQTAEVHIRRRGGGRGTTYFSEGGEGGVSVVVFSVLPPHQHRSILHRTHQEHISTYNNTVETPPLEDSMLIHKFSYVFLGWNWALRMGDWNRNLMSISPVAMSQRSTFQSVEELRSLAPLLFQLHYNYIHT